MLRSRTETPHVIFTSVESAACNVTRVTATMDKQLSALDPISEDSQQLLASLGLDTVPSREQTYREIEERLLLPKETLQEDWLSKYQVWVHCATLIRRLSDLRN